MASVQDMPDGMSNMKPARDPISAVTLPRETIDAVSARVRSRLPALVQDNPPGTALERFDFSVSGIGELELERLLVALARDGAAIVENAISPALCDKLRAEMTPYVEERHTGFDNFTGKVTKRVGMLPARSPASWPILAHPTLMGTCAAVLGHQCLRSGVPRATASPGYPTYPWQVDLTQVIQIGDSETAQALHRDRWAYIFDFESVEPRISTMWAIDDFTVRNGCTRVVPGSHRWPKTRRAKEETDNIAYAAMPKGSVMIYSGSTWHSGGQNKSGRPRFGLNIDYGLAFLRQEENMYLSCPPSIAKDLPKKIQDLIGYSLGGYALGYMGGGMLPKESWEQKKPLNWATTPWGKGGGEAEEVMRKLAKL